MIPLRAKPSGYVHLVRAQDVADANRERPLGFVAANVPVVYSNPRGPICNGWAPRAGWTDNYPPLCRRCPECFPPEVTR